jgi:hypothetical protein
MVRIFAALWLGIVIGVSFMATPIKFQAPSLSLPTALEVGRVTFRLLNQVEWGFAAMLLVVLATSTERRADVLLVALGVIAIVVLQSTWLLPALGRKTDALAGAMVATPSSLHRVFIGIEALKCVFLAYLAIRSGSEARSG